MNTQQAQPKASLTEALKLSLSLLLLAHREPYNRADGRFGSYGKLYQLMTMHIIPNYIDAPALWCSSQEIQELSEYAFPDPLPNGHGKQYCICGAHISTSARMHSLVYHCPICAGGYLRVSNVTRAGSSFADFLEGFAGMVATELRKPYRALPYDWQIHTSQLEQLLIQVIISEEERRAEEERRNV